MAGLETEISTQDFPNVRSDWKPIQYEVPLME
jgi:hypothetical protein